MRKFQIIDYPSHWKIFWGRALLLFHKIPLKLHYLHQPLLYSWFQMRIISDFLHVLTAALTFTLKLLVINLINIQYLKFVKWWFWAVIVFIERYYSYTEFLLQFVYFVKMRMICISPYYITITNIGVDRGMVNWLQ